MSVPSGGFSGSAAANLGPSAPAAPAAPTGNQPHLRVVEPRHHQGDSQDYQSAFENAQRELNDLRGKHAETSRTIDQMRKKTDSQDQVLQRLRHAVAPETAADFKRADPVADEVSKLENELDYYIQQGFLAEKEGRGIPLTIQGNIRDINGQIRYLKETAARDIKIAELEAQLKRQADPQMQLNGAAYQQIDGFVVKALDTIYGAGDEYLPAKNAQWTAIIHQLKAEVQNLQQNHGDVWDKARRSPEKLQRLVNHVITQNMPPKARQIIETERLRKEPMTKGDLWKAYGDAKAIKDPKEREKWMTKVRREMLAFDWGNKRNGRR